jgi:hypothetical protein
MKGLCIRSSAEKGEQQSRAALQLAVSSKDQLDLGLQQALMVQLRCQSGVLKLVII